MTVSSARRPRLQIPLASLFVLVGAFVSTGCPPQHIGRLCELGTTVDASPVQVLTNTGALECPSRICILPSQERGTMTAPLCTAECESDDDCSDGERRGSDPGDFRCRDGFACRTLLPGLEQHELACKRLCVCKDFIRTNDTSGGNTQNCNGTTPIR